MRTTSCSVLLPRCCSFFKNLTKASHLTQGKVKVLPMTSESLQPLACFLCDVISSHHPLIHSVPVRQGYRHSSASGLLHLEFLPSTWITAHFLQVLTMSPQWSHSGSLFVKLGPFPHASYLPPRFSFLIGTCWASLIAQLVKSLPAIQETLVWFLGWKDPLEKGTATHSSILSWRVPGTV